MTVRNRLVRELSRFAPAPSPTSAIPLAAPCNRAGCPDVGNRTTSAPCRPTSAQWDSGRASSPAKQETRSPFVHWGPCSFLHHRQAPYLVENEARSSREARRPDLFQVMNHLLLLFLGRPGPRNLAEVPPVGPMQPHARISIPCLSAWRMHPSAILLRSITFEL